jgi:hypothetical protein
VPFLFSMHGIKSMGLKAFNSNYTFAIGTYLFPNDGREMRVATSISRRGLPVGYSSRAQQKWHLNVGV